MENMRQAFSEVYDIVNHLEETLHNKIPKKFIELIQENKDNIYIPKIDYSKSINEQNLLKDTRIILSLIYRDYICSSEEREELTKIDSIELKKIEEEKAKEFNYDELFKKKKEHEYNNSNTKMVVYKESIFKRIINRIRELFRI